MAQGKDSKRWYQRHVDDEYVRRAQKEGYRSRAAYKLEEIDQRHRLLKPGQAVVDLGAAPGSWSQFVQKKLGGRGRVWALDLLTMAPLPGVECLQGDFAEQDVLDLLLQRLQGNPVDLVISDMAPNITGIALADQARVMALAELAMDFALQVLHEKGVFLVKVFQGSDYTGFLQQMRKQFKEVRSIKPKASRSKSREIYLLGRQLQQP